MLNGEKKIKIAQSAILRSRLDREELGPHDSGSEWGVVYSLRAVHVLHFFYPLILSISFLWCFVVAW